MKSKRIFGMAVLCGVFVFAGCKHEHTWEEATCAMPKHCTECEATEGEILEHTWKSATCTEPKTCKVCGTTEGEAQGHSFLSATCVSAEGCVICGEKRGEPVAHTGETVGKCKLCGEAQNKDLMLALGERHEEAVEKIKAIVNQISLEAVEVTTENPALSNLDMEGDLENQFVGEYPLATLTLGQYLEWAYGLIEKLYWVDRMEDYTELRALYEEVYSMCADYQELSALKNRTKKIIDLIPEAVPETRERTGGVYDIRLSDREEVTSEQKEQVDEALELWQADMMEKITWMAEMDTEMKEWENEYNSVKALFK